MNVYLLGSEPVFVTSVLWQTATAFASRFPVSSLLNFCPMVFAEWDTAGAQPLPAAAGTLHDAKAEPQSGQPVGNACLLFMCHQYAHLKTTVA